MYSSFAWLDATALSVWLRESPSLWAFPFCSDPAHGGDGIPGGYECGHGSSCSRICAEDSALALREVLPRDEDQLCSECRVLLLIAYPTKALTNPLFYIKSLLIAAAADR